MDQANPPLTEGRHWIFEEVLPHHELPVQGSRKTIVEKKTILDSIIWLPCRKGPEDFGDPVAGFGQLAAPARTPPDDRARPQSEKGPAREGWKWARQRNSFLQAKQRG